MTAEIAAADFAPHVGRDFPTDEGPLRLVEVTPARDAIARGHRAFSLVFRGAPEQPLAQGIRSIDHPTLGTLSIFVVPIGPDAHGLRYEAVFN